MSVFTGRQKFLHDIAEAQTGLRVLIAALGVAAETGEPEAVETFARVMQRDGENITVQIPLRDPDSFYNSIDQGRDGAFLASEETAEAQEKMRLSFGCVYHTTRNDIDGGVHADELTYYNKSVFMDVSEMLNECKFQSQQFDSEDSPVWFTELNGNDSEGNAVQVRYRFEARSAGKAPETSSCPSCGKKRILSETHEETGELVCKNCA